MPTRERFNHYIANNLTLVLNFCAPAPKIEPMNMTYDPDELFDFPCQFPIKVMAQSRDSLAADVTEIIERHNQDGSEIQVQVRASSQGRYSSVTVTIKAFSREQLDNIYLELTAQEWVLMAL